MANLSDAFGIIRVDRVAKEFIEYLKAVQGEESQAYYVLADYYDFKDLVIDEDNNIEFKFSANGRWAYYNNLEGYLEGSWMQNEEDKPHHDKLLEAILKNNGMIEVEYSDSDTAMDWMSSGVYTVEVVDGEVSFSSSEQSEELTITGFAEHQGFSEWEALDYIYGDEVSDKYNEYYEEWKKDHEFIEGVSEPSGPAEWYDNEYQEEE